MMYLQFDLRSCSLLQYEFLSVEIQNSRVRGGSWDLAGVHVLEPT